MTRLDDALVGVQRLGLDTAPFIYFVERNPAYVNLVREVVRRVSTGALLGHTMDCGRPMPFRSLQHLGQAVPPSSQMMSSSSG